MRPWSNCKRPGPKRPRSMKSEPAMEEHLVGYLLGSLDPVTHQRVEAYLRTRPEAQETLYLLRQAVAPLAEDGEDFEPPPGLVLATLDRVAELRSLAPAQVHAIP